MANDLIRHFFGGFVRLHILYHAAKEPICGVDMIAELRRHGYHLSPGTLYPILHTLEAGKYVCVRRRRSPASDASITRLPARAKS